jgi:hypothetical protein
LASRRDPIDRCGLGVRQHRAYRPLDDPNYVVGELEFDTQAEAQACSDALQALWRSRQTAPALSGVPGVRIVETVEDNLEIVEGHQY